MTAHSCNPPILQGDLVEVSKTTRELALSFYGEPETLEIRLKETLPGDTSSKPKLLVDLAVPLLGKLAASSLLGERLCALTIKRIMLSRKNYLSNDDVEWFGQFLGGECEEYSLARSILEEILRKERLRDRSGGFE